MSGLFRNYRGVRGLMVAELQEDTLETLTYGTPIRFAGVKEIGEEPEESAATEYYDDQPAIVIDAEGEDKYKLVTSVLEEKVRAVIEGRKFDEESGAYFGTPKQKPYVAIGFIGTDTDGQEEYVWVYKTKLSGGGASRKTKDNGTDSSGLEWEATSIYTSHKFKGASTAGDAPLKFYKLKAGGTVTEQKFFEKVYIPGEAAAMAAARAKKKHAEA